MNDTTVGQKLCPLCGKPMAKIRIETARRDYNLWTCVPCVRESDKKEARQKK
jgi:predicted RNA-binding Zn-ribbon protein involved in translation (DUF1610 family)